MDSYTLKSDCRRFGLFLDKAVAGPKDIRALQEFFGYCLRGLNIFPKFLFLLGAGGDGQNVAVMVLRMILGHDNCSWYSIPEMMAPGVLSGISGKSANISYNGKARDMTGPFFQSLVRGQPAWGLDEQGHGFAFVPSCKFVFVAGHLPTDLRDAGAFLDTALVVRFRNCLTALDQDMSFLIRMKDEYRGIRAWALRGLDRLLRNGRFTDPARDYVYGNAGAPAAVPGALAGVAGAA